MDNLVAKEEYQNKKTVLLKSKITVEEKLNKMSDGAIAWLEPCANFLKAAHAATLLAQSKNLRAQKKFLKKTGSNHEIGLQRLTVQWPGPWALLTKNPPDSKAFGVGGGNKKFFPQEKNAIQQTRERAAFEEREYVGDTGFEPATFRSRTGRATGLR